METLEQIMVEVAKIRKVIADCPGKYVRGKTLMDEASARVDANPGKALKIISSARQEIEQEAGVMRKWNDIRKRRLSYPSYVVTDVEIDAEKRMEEQLREGDYEGAISGLKTLEEALVDDIQSSVECEVTIMLDDAEIDLGRGNTLVAKVNNASSFPMRLLKLVGKSNQAQVIVFDEFRGAVPPRGSKEVRVNVIPNMEGDIVVELEGLVEMSSRQFPVKWHASMKVMPVPVSTFVQMVQPPVPTGPAILATPATNVGDPLELIDKGTVDQWYGLIATYYSSKGPIKMEGLAAKNKEYQTSVGYRALFQAVLLQDYSRTKDWENWFDAQGFVGDEMTRRCSDLLFHLRTAPGQYEIELDGNVGSSNNNYLISALHIASGLIALEREKRKDIKTWEISGTREGQPFRIMVERSVKKGENGALPRSVFKLTLG